MSSMSSNLVVYTPGSGKSKSSSVGDETKAPAPLPTYWIQMHTSATSASLVTGAFAYAVTHLIGSTTTSIATNSLSIAGLILAQGANVVAGGAAARTVEAATATSVHTLKAFGDSATKVSSVVSATASAAVVGSMFLLGNTAQQLYREFRQSETDSNAPIEVEQTEESDYLLYDLTEVAENEVVEPTSASSPSVADELEVE